MIPSTGLQQSSDLGESRDVFARRLGHVARVEWPGAGREPGYWRARRHSPLEPVVVDLGRLVRQAVRRHDAAAVEVVAEPVDHVVIVVVVVVIVVVECGLRVTCRRGGSGGRGCDVERAAVDG